MDRLMALVGVSLLAASAPGPAANSGAAGRGDAPEVPEPAPRIPNGAWASALAQHPHLLGPRARLQELARAKPREYAAIRGHTSLVAAGIVHAVEGLPADRIAPFLERARENVARGATNIHQDTWVWLTDVALAYDFFHDSIPADERTAMVEWMNAHLGHYTDDENAFHNSTLSKVLCYLRVAYATWGDNPRAREFRDHALVGLYEGKLLPVFEEFGAGGGFTECGGYTRHCLWHLVQGLELARRLEGYDGFAKAPRFFYQRLAYELLQPYPAREVDGVERFSYEGDAWTGRAEYPRLTRAVLAQYFRGSDLARAVANWHRPAVSAEAKEMAFLFEEEPDAPLPLDRFPPAHLAAGIGKLYARSDWSEDATWLRFECGDYWNQHQHYDVGHFEVFRYEALAMESAEHYTWGSPHAINWLLRSIAHNCILVHQPDEDSWRQMRDGGRIPPANDGGQAKKWDYVVGDLEQWKKSRERYERGRIIAYDSRPEFVYVVGDCTRAYAASKLSLWIRQILFVRPHTFFILDRVVSTRPEYQKTWLLHCHEEPSVESGVVRIRNGRGRLAVQTLLPEKAVTRKVEGYTYGGQTYEPERSSASPVSARWRVEVLPPAPQTEDLFLHVLSTGESPQPARLIRRGRQVGARVGTTEVLFEGRAGGTLRVGGRSHRLRAEVRKGRYE